MHESLLNYGNCLSLNWQSLSSFMMGLGNVYSSLPSLGACLAISCVSNVTLQVSGLKES